MNHDTLQFASGNAKLSKDTAILSLPAGHSCPFAKECLSKADKLTGKIVDGQHCKFRCYAASSESLFKNVRNSRWSNFDMLRNHKTVLGMADLIETSIHRKKNIKFVRFHQSGDFFNQMYFDAWLLVAQYNPKFIFYGYTKALPFLVKRLNELPNNFRIVASQGGTHDSLIDMLGLRSVKVVFSKSEAKKQNLVIDHDDSHAWNSDKNFAVLLHGNQPAGSEAGKAWYQIYKHGNGGYRSDYFHHKKKNKQNTFKFSPRKALLDIRKVAVKLS